MPWRRCASSSCSPSETSSSRTRGAEPCSSRSRPATRGGRRASTSPNTSSIAPPAPRWSEPLVERRRAIAGWLPIGGLLGAFRALADKLRTPKGQAAAGGVTAAVAARRDAVASLSGGGVPAAQSAPPAPPLDDGGAAATTAVTHRGRGAPSFPSRPTGSRYRSACRFWHQASRSSRSSPAARGWA